MGVAVGGSRRFSRWVSPQKSPTKIEMGVPTKSGCTKNLAVVVPAKRWVSPQKNPSNKVGVPSKSPQKIPKPSHGGCPHNKALGKVQKISKTRWVSPQKNPSKKHQRWVSPQKTVGVPSKNPKGGCPYKKVVQKSKTPGRGRGFWLRAANRRVNEINLNGEIASVNH